MNAKEIATLAHEGQFRRDGVTPYIEHSEAVASAFEEGTLEHDAALLHDVFEDDPIFSDNPSLGQKYLLDAGFSPVVVEAVVLLTHAKHQPYAEYIENIVYYSKTSEAHSLALKVKIADMAANLADAPTEHQIKKYTNALKIIAKNL